MVSSTGGICRPHCAADKGACILLQVLTRSWSSVQVSKVVDLQNSNSQLIRNEQPCAVWAVQHKQQRHHQYVPDKTDMHTQAAVYASTGKAYIHSIRHRCPGRVLCGAIKADLDSSNRL
jgi:hypothetical protein